MKRNVSSMRPPAARPPLNLMRGRSATPALDGRTSRAESTASSRAPRSPLKRKEREFEGESESTNINVVVRCRGRNDREVRENSGVVVSTQGIKGSTVDLSMGGSALGNKTYQFDKVFSPAANQSMIFDEVVSPILDEVLDGFNCTIFAYGQTGTGKTYTMTGDISNLLPLPDAAGIIPRVLYALFQRLEADEIEHSVKCSFVELYNEALRDLLSTDDSAKLKIFDDNTKKGHSTTMVQGMEERHLKTAAQGITLLREGSHKRQVAATKCNDLSSRGHTVFAITVYVKRTTEAGEEYLSAGKLNLVDLAGSENIQRSGAENKRAAEAGLINKSLLTLGRVINALVERSVHIPYRESNLTRLLQDSLGGRTKTCIIATLSPAKSNLEETISTLDYAFRAKNIRNKPQVNDAISKKTLLKEFTVEIEKLKSELIATRQRNGVYLTQENYDEITSVSESRRILSDEQRERIDTMEADLRIKVEELFKITTTFQMLKKDNEQVQQALDGTKGILAKTEIILEHTRRNLSEETQLRKAHQKTEGQLADMGQDMISTLGKTTADIEALRSKIRRKSELQSQNRRNWNSSQSQVLDTTRLVEDRLEDFQQQQEELMHALSSRMQAFVRDELDKLEGSRCFLQEKMGEYEKSEQEVNEQTLRSRDDANEVLEEIKMLRADVQQKIGAGLDELSAAAETISADIMTELEAFRTQVHASYASLGRDFKTTFDDLVNGLNEQQAENERLHQQVLVSNTALLDANRASQRNLREMMEEERQKSAVEREQLLLQISALVNTHAETQNQRWNSRLVALSDGIGAANSTFEAEQDGHREGLTAWSRQSRNMLASVSKSRDMVKAKIKTDFAMATQQSSSIRDTTASVHASTVQTVASQMAHLDGQLQCFDDIVSRIRNQNNSHHAAHAASLAALSSTVHASYSSVGKQVSSSFDRIRCVERDVCGQAGKLMETLASLAAEADIRAPLYELREAVGGRKLMEYEATGETPQRASYHIPSHLPRTEAEEEAAGWEATARSPFKQPIFSDAATDTVKVGVSKSALSRSTSANTHQASTVSSLRELDVNVVLQESAHTQPLPLVSQCSDSMVMAVPASKKQRGDGEGIIKLPTKTARRTVHVVAGEKADRENLTITTFSTSVGPGLGSRRRLRSQGSG